MGIRYKQIEVLPYNPEWPRLFEKEATYLTEVLGGHCLEVHHIGSTSVPGLKAKQDIDVLCIVDSLSNSLVLQERGFVFKGELNIPLRYYFSKNTPESKVNLHVVEKGHAFIEQNLAFRNYLRVHDEVRDAYAELKEELLKNPKSFQKIGSRFSGYCLNKDQFIMKVFQKMGFDSLWVRFCMHDLEWETYHRIRDEQIYAPIGIVYDRNHPTIHADNHYHLVLKKGVKVVSIAHVEWLNEDEAALRSLATDEPYKRKSYASYLLRFIEDWLLHHKKNTIKMHANLRFEKFYRKRGYVDVTFDDPCINEEFVNLGKKLS